VAGRAAALGAARARRASTRTGPADLVERLASGTRSKDEARKAAASLSREDKGTIERLHEALEGAVQPRAVRALAAALGKVGGPPAIPVLSRALARVTESAPPGADSAGDLETRAALHAALAALDSGIALHDLRELIARHPPRVTPRLLDAAARVGNASLVPALARAASEDPALLERCASTYAAIAGRDKLRRSSAALRRVRAEHRPALESFLIARAGGRR
jgi:hypothetical protein